MLVRSYREGRGVEGFADDYAFLIQGLLDLYEASFDVSWLKFAIELQETQDRLFLDEKRGGYFGQRGSGFQHSSAHERGQRQCEPAASSVAALNLLRLAQIRNEGAWRGARGQSDRCVYSPDFAFSERDAADVGRARLQFEQTSTDRDCRKTGRAGYARASG